MGALIRFLASSFSGILSYLLSTVVFKFALFLLIFLAVTEIIPILIEVFLPDNVDISSLLSDIPSDVAYMIAFFKIDVGIKSMLSAYASRFLIRRIPFIG